MRHAIEKTVKNVATNHYDVLQKQQPIERIVSYLRWWLNNVTGTVPTCWMCEDSSVENEAVWNKLMWGEGFSCAGCNRVVKKTASFNGPR